MSGPPDPSPPPAEAVARAVRRPALPKAILAICLVLAVLVSAIGVGVRYGVLLPQTRLLIEAQLQGLKLGRLGTLKVVGLEGDVWRAFTVRELSISDARGVWLSADHVAVRWSYAPLFGRKLRVQDIRARHVLVLRRPELGPKQASKALPVSVQIDAMAARVELLPAFSVQRGVYDLNGQLAIRRKGGMAARAAVVSVLRPGDHLNLVLDLLKGHPLSIHADAVEAGGGALAGALGLQADRPFALEADAGGTRSQGKAHAILTSGGETPIVLDGVWRPQGGEAQVRLQLAASTLTRGLAARLGPTLNASVRGTKADKDLFDLTGQARSDNLTVVAYGRGDLGRRRLGPDGLALSGSTTSLSRLVGGPDMGPAVIAGRLKGVSGDWRFAGQARVSRLAMAGYTLQEAAGPLEFIRAKGQTVLKIKAAGTGGAGKGVLAALLGGRPTADFEGARLADGRLDLRSLKATGDGLSVDATGGRSLLGGLTFKGKAAFSNLARAHDGASGAVTATWSAMQGRPGSPWTLGMDAVGERFATGYAELDRLLGSTPRFKGSAEVGAGQVAISSSSLDGAAVHANAAGVSGADGLKLKLDWSASGPFRAGPVEISGKARGTGAVTGTLGAPRADLLADFEAIDLPRLPLTAAHAVITFQRAPDGSSGAVTLTAASAYGPATAHSDFRFPGDGVELTGLGLNAGGVKAGGSLALRSHGASTADLKVAVGKGAFLTSGQVAGTVRITDAPGGAQAQIALTADNAILPGETFAVGAARFTADGPLARLPYALKADGSARGGKWLLDGRGDLSQAQGGWRLTYDGDGRYGRRDLKTTEPAVFRFGASERTARLRLAASDGGTIALDGRLASDGAQVKAQVQRVGLGLIDEDLSGRFDADLDVHSQGQRLAGLVTARLDAARGRGSDPKLGLNGDLRMGLANEELSIDGDLTNAQGLDAKASIVLPAVSRASPFSFQLDRQRPIRGQVSAVGEVRPLWDLLVGGERELAGRVKLQGRLGGTLADIRATGDAAVEQGRFSDTATGLVIQDANIVADLADNEVNVRQASGVDGHGGAIEGQGRVSLQRDGASTFRLNLKGFRLIDNDLATATATGQGTIDRGADGRVRLSGALTIDRADVAAKTPTPSGVTPMEVVEINRPASLVGATAPAVARGPGVALDVTLKAPRRVFLRGRGLDAELSLDAHVTGTTSQPRLSGAARVVRGEYDFAGRRFEFDERSVVYLATSPNDIRLDLSATRDDPSLTAVVRIRGTAAKPEITLTSTPTLPSDEVLSQVLFGRSASQLSPLEAAQLASALSALAGGGGFDVVGNLRAFARLDRLSFGGGESGMTVSGGKYLTDDVYLELTGGGREGPSAQVEWRIGKSLSIVSKIAGQGDGKLSVRWRKDY